MSKPKVKAAAKRNRRRRNLPKEIARSIRKPVRSRTFIVDDERSHENMTAFIDKMARDLMQATSTPMLAGVRPSQERGDERMAKAVLEIKPRAVIPPSKADAETFERVANGAYQRFTNINGEQVTDEDGDAVFVRSDLDIPAQALAVVELMNKIGSPILPAPRKPAPEAQINECSKGVAPKDTPFRRIEAAAHCVVELESRLAFCLDQLLGAVPRGEAGRSAEAQVSGPVIELINQAADITASVTRMHELLDRLVPVLP